MISLPGTISPDMVVCFSLEGEVPRITVLVLNNGYKEEEDEDKQDQLSPWDIPPYRW
jgi:hypothetical protein